MSGNVEKAIMATFADCVTNRSHTMYQKKMESAPYATTHALSIIILSMIGQAFWLLKSKVNPSWCMSAITAITRKRCLWKQKESVKVTNLAMNGMNIVMTQPAQCQATLNITAFTASWSITPISPTSSLTTTFGLQNQTDTFAPTIVQNMVHHGRSIPWRMASAPSVATGQIIPSISG